MILYRLAGFNLNHNATIITQRIGKKGLVNTVIATKQNGHINLLVR